MKEYSTIQNLLPTDQRRPIFIIAPWRLFNSLYDYNQVENIGLEDYTVPFVSSNLIPRHLLPLGSTQNLDVGLFQGFLSSMNLQSFETCYVQHCPQAYGVAITHKSGWKIVYSGDCRPSGDLVEIGRDATVCIHEATVAETQPQEALDKMHSTTGEAIMIGKRMGAKYILLTHFSQKWSKIPEFVLEWEKHKEQVEKYGNVGIAFDHMAVKVGEMWKLPLFYSAFEVMYGEERGKKAWLRQMALRGASKREGEEIEDPRQSKRKQIEKDSGNEVTLEMV
jgi:ribonuclease Z